MADKPEVIQQELEQTRSALADKLGMIGEKISGTVENVTDTVESVTSAVENTVEAVTGTVEAVGESAQETVEAVKQAFNIPEQIQARPWLWFGGAIAAGFVAGKFLVPQTQSLIGHHAHHAAPDMNGHSHRSSSTYAGRAAGEFFGDHEHYQTGRPTNGFSTHAADTSSQPAESKSWLIGLMERFGPDIDKLKGLALGSLFGVTRDMISQSLPQSLKSEVCNVINNITETVGGKPIQGPVLDDADESQQKGMQYGESDNPEMERAVGAAQGQGQAGLGRPHRR
jgi:ElaB/YqjD/DUF883 family membrane-anchored ribosome-binding protein